MPYYFVTVNEYSDNRINFINAATVNLAQFYIDMKKESSLNTIVSVVEITESEYDDIMTHIMKSKMKSTSFSEQMGLLQAYKYDLSEKLYKHLSEIIEKEIQKSLDILLAIEDPDDFEDYEQRIYDIMSCVSDDTLSDELKKTWTSHLVAINFKWIHSITHPNIFFHWKNSFRIQYVEEHADAETKKQLNVLVQSMKQLKEKSDAKEKEELERRERERKEELEKEKEAKKKQREESQMEQKTEKEMKKAEKEKKKAEKEKKKAERVEGKKSNDDDDDSSSSGSYSYETDSESYSG